MNTHIEIVVVEERCVTLVQARDMLKLQIACFAGQVTNEELAEDFDRPPVARVLAYHQNEMIACAEVFKRDIIYQGKTIKLGGFSPCIKADYRNQGVGTQVCKAAMRYSFSLR